MKESLARTYQQQEYLDTLGSHTMQHTQRIVVTLTKEYKINLPVCFFHNNMLVFYIEYF